MSVRGKENLKQYYILINTELGESRHYGIRDEQKPFRVLGAVMSRHCTIAAALKTQKSLPDLEWAARNTYIVVLHFWPALGAYIGEEHVGGNNSRYRPLSYWNRT